MPQVSASNPLGSVVGQTIGGIITINFPITIEFDIARANNSETNYANIRIYNLNEVTRNAIFKDWGLLDYMMPVELKAGYGNDLSTIFLGTIFESCSYKNENSTEIITEMTGWDGGEAMATAYGAIQENNPILKTDLIKKVINTMNGRGVTLGVVSDYSETNFLKFRADGLSWKTLKSIVGDDVFIDNGKVHCLKKTDSPTQNVFQLNSSTGLLASPRKYQQNITVEILFEPKIMLGQKVNLVSSVNSIYNNIYTVTGIRHTGIISGAVNGKCKTTLTMVVGAAQEQDILQKAING